ncbi:MAG TPA: DUF11 domain-containing protein [Thermoleophilaceae bacterium]
MRAPTRLGLLALVAGSLAATPAQASITLGQTQGATDNCGSSLSNVQASTSSGASYVSDRNGVIVSWNYLAGTFTPTLRLRVYHATGDPTVWFTRSESPSKAPGSGAGQVQANHLNTFTESPGIPIQTDDHLGLTTSGASSWSCISTGDAGDVIRQKAPPDPPVGQNSTASFGPNPNTKIGVTAVVEPDADGDNFGDETQDSCPTDPTTHSGACPVDVSIVKTASPNPKVGEGLTYTLAVKNNHATNPAGGVTVVDSLPSGVSFFAASPGCAGTTTVICALGSMAPGETKSVAIIVRPRASGPLANTASVTTTSSDTDTNNNSSTSLLTVAAPVPVLSKLKLSPTSFSAGTKGGSVAAAAKAGTVVTYKLNTAATTTLSVLKPAPGIKSGKACVKPPKHPPKGAKKCTRYVSIGTFKHADAAGTARFRFTGRLKGKTLRSGRYRLRAGARNASGASKLVEAGFKIK